jgi:hypothetical protein
VSKGPSDFKETNVKRMCRAVLAAGLKIARIEYDRNSRKVVVYPENGEAQVANGMSNEPNEWDEK